MQAVIDWMGSSTLGQWVVATEWVWPAAEIVHFLGLSLLLGSMLIVDLRLLGLFRTIQYEATHPLLRWALLGFGLNTLSGIIFLFGDPGRYEANVGFRIKAVLIMLAGLNAALFYWKIQPRIHLWPADTAPPLLARSLALLSLLSWFSILLLGRLIPYVGTG